MMNLVYLINLLGFKFINSDLINLVLDFKSVKAHLIRKILDINI